MKDAAGKREDQARRNIFMYVFCSISLSMGASAYHVTPLDFVTLCKLKDLVEQREASGDENSVT